MAVCRKRECDIQCGIDSSDDDWYIIVDNLEQRSENKADPMAHISLRVSFAKCSEGVSTIHIIGPLFPQSKKETAFYSHSNQAPHITHLPDLPRAAIYNTSLGTTPTHSLYHAFHPDLSLLG
jgi:hypothetical protein